MIQPWNFFKGIARHGVFIALATIILFGWLRYDHFLGLFNIMSVLRYNAMFALVALGMCFVIMSGGIDLSVGATAALSSVVASVRTLPFAIYVVASVCAFASSLA